MNELKAIDAAERVEISALHVINHNLYLIYERIEHMAIVSDQAVADLTTAIDNAVTVITEAVAEIKANPSSARDVTPVLEALATSLNTASDGLKGVETPAPVAPAEGTAAEEAVETPADEAAEVAAGTGDASPAAP